MTTTSVTSRPWNPSDRDRLIYRWVKFDGHKQSWVADQLNLNQSSVSRIIDRYERWIAHGGPAQQGALNRDERLRAQVALTFERNEWIITSSLRMAGEMETMSDATRSTTKHYCSEPSREIEVRTENSIRDRTDKAHRYLRLAHRVGMDQLQLLKEYDLPALEPFTLDPNEYSEALADARSGFQSGTSPFESVPCGAGFQPAQEEFGAGLPTPPPPRPQVSCLAAAASPQSPIPNPPSEISPAPPPPLSPSPTPPMPAVHNPELTQPPLTPDSTITSLEIKPNKKPLAHAYALPQNPPEPTDRLHSVLNASAHESPPPIRILPLLTPLP